MIEEYLKTTYRPDREYIDGEVRERNLGEVPHSLLQSRLVLYFSALESQVQLIPLVDCRVQVSATRFRVPDISVVRGKRPQTKVLVTPPLIVVEIQSPEDSWYDMADRIADYVRFGIPNIWVREAKWKLRIWCWKRRTKRSACRCARFSRPLTGWNSAANVNQPAPINASLPPSRSSL